MKKIYILLHDNKTIFGNAIQSVTRYEYSHVSLSLDDTFIKLYSFGRKKPNNPIHGGLVTYGINSEFYIKRPDARCTIYTYEIEDYQYDRLSKILVDYENKKDTLKYNLLPILIYRITSKKYKAKNSFVCSTFVANVLNEAGVSPIDKDPDYVTPQDYSNYFQDYKIYEGIFQKVHKKES